MHNTPRRLFLGEGAPLSSLFDGLKVMGQAYVPCVLLVLAGSLAQGLEGFDAGLLRRAGVVMLQRFLLMPAVTFAMVAAGKRAGVVPAHDHLLVFILLLQGRFEWFVCVVICRYGRLEPSQTF